MYPPRFPGLKLEAYTSCFQRPNDNGGAFLLYALWQLCFNSLQNEEEDIRVWDGDPSGDFIVRARIEEMHKGVLPYLIWLSYLERCLSEKGAIPVGRLDYSIIYRLVGLPQFGRKPDVGVIVGYGCYIMEYSDSFAPLDATWKNILMNGNLAEDG